ncbi:hypothetical protein ACW2Q0_28385 [Nocardia sp. R16R-3T]
MSRDYIDELVDASLERGRRLGYYTPPRRPAPTPEPTRPEPVTAPACETCNDTGRVACWSPGGLCADAPGPCEACGPCTQCDHQPAPIPEPATPNLLGLARDAITAALHLIGRNRR